MTNRENKQITAH